MVGQNKFCQNPAALFQKTTSILLQSLRWSQNLLVTSLTISTHNIAAVLDIVSRMQNGHTNKVKSKLSTKPPRRIQVMVTKRCTCGANRLKPQQNWNRSGLMDITNKDIHRTDDVDMNDRFLIVEDGKKKEKRLF